MHQGKPLGDEGAVQPGQWSDIGDGGKRNEIEPSKKVWRWPGGRKKAAIAQTTLHRDKRHENDPRRAKLAETGKIVLPVWVDDDCFWQNLRCLMMIEYNRVEAEPCRLGERHMARRPAIHRDQKLRAIARKGLDCLRVGAVAFENPVRNIDHARRAAAAEIIVKQRRGSSAIDVIISENRDPFSALYRFRYAASRRLHALQRERVRQQVSQRWVEIVLRSVRRDAASGKNAGQEIAGSMNLRNR